MQVKEILKEAFDVDQGFGRTFLTMFLNPRKVIDHPDKFNRPWKYAFYVVSISCLVTWFFIHWLLDDLNDLKLWAIPGHVLNLDMGYQNFYENTQPLKQLLLKSFTLYIALFILFFKDRKRKSGLFTICLYVIGQTLFITFILQTLGIVILRKGILSQEIVFIAVVSNCLYMAYALYRLFDDRKSIRIAKISIAVALSLILYSWISTRTVHYAYYNIIHRSDISWGFPKVNEPTEIHSGNFFVRRPIEDQSYFKIESYAPAGEIAKLFVYGYSHIDSSRKWTYTFFEKINRYSPEMAQVVTGIDSSSHRLWIVYRLPNDLNSHLEVNCLDMNGRLLFSRSVDTGADDIEVNDIDFDGKNVIVVGSARSMRDNLSTGMVIKLDGSTGKKSGILFIGEKQFASTTSLRRVQVNDDSILVEADNESRLLFLFKRKTKKFYKIDRSFMSSIVSRFGDEATESQIFAS